MLFQPKKKGKKGGNKQVVVRNEDVIEYISLKEIDQEMAETVVEMKQEYTDKIRLSSDVTLFENISLPIDGSKYYLNELAEINQINPRLVSIDMSGYPEYMPQVEKLLQEHELNLNPAINGTEIKVPLPLPNAQQSKAKVKQAETILKFAKKKLQTIKDVSTKELKNVEALPKDLNYLISQQLDVFVINHSKVMDEAFQAKKKSLKI